MDEQACAKRPRLDDDDLVSIIVAVHNAEKYLKECFDGLLAQDYEGQMEVSIRLDGCTDQSAEVCKEWEAKFGQDSRFTVVVSHGEGDAKGAAHARNAAIRQSKGLWMCIHDADDISEPNRISEQVAAAKKFPNAIVGSYFVRIPEDATERYARWCNSMNQDKLFAQRFKELPMIHPTWFMSRKVWENVGGYVENKLAEDLRFFYDHLELNAALIPERRDELLHLIQKPLVRYRHLLNSVSSMTPRKLLFQIKAKALEDAVLKKWDSFSIWGAGRDGKELFKCLSPETQKKVLEMYDIDPKKIQNGYYHRELKIKIPVVHFTEATPPLICCVAMDRGGEFEENLKKLTNILIHEKGFKSFEEGVDYFHFV